MIQKYKAVSGVGSRVRSRSCVRPAAASHPPTTAIIAAAGGPAPRGIACFFLFYQRQNVAAQLVSSLRRGNSRLREKEPDKLPHARARVLAMQRRAQHRAGIRGTHSTPNPPSVMPLSAALGCCVRDKHGYCVIIIVGLRYNRGCINQRAVQAPR